MQSPSRAASLQLFLAVLVTALASGCIRHGKDDYAYGSTVVYETEFNGNAASADFVGFIAPGSDWIIEGDVGFGADDYDGFAFVADYPTEVRFTLTIHDPFAELGVYVWDPDAFGPGVGDFVFAFDSGANPEVGSFDVFVANTEFHLVVAPLFGAADYTLAVHGHTLFPGPAAQAGGASGLGSSAEAPSAEARGRMKAYGGDPDREPPVTRAPRPVQVGQVVIVSADGTLATRDVFAIRE